MTILPDPAASQALLIGAHDYESLAALPAVERNLAGLTRAFTDPELWGLPPTHCVALPQPSSAQDVLDTLNSVALRATDTLVVYYAGHGLIDPHSDELYLALPGSDQERLYSALPFEWVRRAILDPRIGARHKVVILDCCYSGRALTGGMSGTTQVVDHALIDGTSLMAASAKTRKALSPPGEEFTAFTGELITALTEGIVDGPSLLDMQTLYRHLYVTLAAKSRPLPQQGNRNTGGQIALARNRAHPTHRPQPPSRTAPKPRPAPKPQPSSMPRTGPPPPAASPTPTPRTGPPPPAPSPDRTSDTRGEEHPQATAPRQHATPEAARTDGQRHSGRSASARTRTIAVVSAVLLVAGVSTTLALLNGSHRESDGKSKGGVTEATYNAAVGHVLKPGGKKGGTLKFINAADADSWDPQRGYYGFVWNFARYYARQLVTYDPESKGVELTPDLATTKARISNHGRTYTYTLSKGATWEDGSPVTSKDIKYGIERLWASDVISGGPSYLQQALDPDGTYRGPYKDTSPTGLKAIETPNPRTIVFKLPRANGDFEQMLAMVAASPVKRSQDTKAKYGLRPFSSGPYKFRSYSPGKSLELVRNPHWQPSSDPVRNALPDKISVTIANNPDFVDAALLKGSYDLALSPHKLGPLGRTAMLSDSDRNKNLDTPRSGFVRYAGFPQAVKPMGNIHCRRAVIHAADRRSLQTALGGRVTGGDLAPNLLPPGIKGADPTFDPYGVLKNGGKPNVAKARDELKACGRPDGFSTRIAVRNDRPPEVYAAESLKSALAKVGIKAEVERFDGARSPDIVGVPAEVKRRGYGIVIAGWGADFPTGQAFWRPLVDSRLQLPSGSYNLAGVDSPAIDKLLAEAIAEPDPGKAGEAYEQINHKVADNAYYLPFVYDKYVSWRSPRLTDVHVSPAYGAYDYARLGVSGT
ncbi:ABC transporter substrate-binding protein [Streptomyces sp. NEAU-S7GS2]|uniref:caspase, EACC1-associated type n=1 Tax=Streptomyces sp. NEAU-S7GS2 TaxID=2202000 RepID=UPI000D700149|nr:ABC transporter substrate-binding protein [Streptomyces sp. NEAU-S7GS2]AWN31196.1 oligopeptide-binding lipoprotein [Streptomyces sp. NEAU-S7GS2]